MLMWAAMAGSSLKSELGRSAGKAYIRGAHTLTNSSSSSAYAFAKFFLLMDLSAWKCVELCYGSYLEFITRLSAMVNTSTVLWLQFAYLVWQFVRVAKYCRVPYAILVHTFMWVTGRWSHPFALRVFLVLETGRDNFYVSRKGAESILKDCLDCTDHFKVESKEADPNAIISIPAVNYKLCIRESRLNESFVWNYLRDKPECFARKADLLLPNFALLDRVTDLKGLRMICQSKFIPVKRQERFLAIPDSERELNQSFMRLLSTIPLMAQALGYKESSVFISVAILVVDLFSPFFNWVWELFTSWFFSLLTMVVVNTYFRPQTREILSTLSSIVSTRMKYSDQVRRSLVRVSGGDVVYTMSPFNLADFEKIIDRPFERKRKTPELYSEEKFGKFTFCGGEMEIKEGSSVLTHYIDGSRIDSIFMDDGSFYNFRNNEHLHFGIWKRGKDDSKETKDLQDSKETKDFEDSEDNFNNFQDLLQIMEEMQMLPFIQIGKDRFRSMDFNMFLSPGRSLKDLTFVVAKKVAIIGG